MITFFCSVHFRKVSVFPSCRTCATISLRQLFRIASVKVEELRAAEQPA